MWIKAFRDKITSEKIGFCGILGYLFKTTRYDLLLHTAETLQNTQIKRTNLLDLLEMYLKYADAFFTDFGYGNWRQGEAWNLLLSGRLRWTLLPKERYAGVSQTNKGDAHLQPRFNKLSIYQCFLSGRQKCLMKVKEGKDKPELVGCSRIYSEDFQLCRAASLLSCACVSSCVDSTAV